MILKQITRCVRQIAKAPGQALAKRCTAVQSRIINYKMMMAPNDDETIYYIYHQSKKAFGDSMKETKDEFKRDWLYNKYVIIKEISSDKIVAYASVTKRDGKDENDTYDFEDNTGKHPIHTLNEIFDKNVKAEDICECDDLVVIPGYREKRLSSILLTITPFIAKHFYKVPYSFGVTTKDSTERVRKYKRGFIGSIEIESIPTAKNYADDPIYKDGLIYLASNDKCIQKAKDLEWFKLEQNTMIFKGDPNKKFSDKAPVLIELSPEIKTIIEGLA